MTDTKAKMLVMMAYDNGAEIEFIQQDIDERWRGTLTPAWDWSNFNYRVKEELVVEETYYEVMYEGGNGWILIDRLRTESELEPIYIKTGREFKLPKLEVEDEL